MFEIIGYSEKFYEKEKNGDSFKYEDLKEEKLLIAIVADGVSRQPCDWYASQLCCEKFIENFKTADAFQISKRIKTSVYKTNEALLNVTGKCANLHSTLSLLVWDYEMDSCYIANIGDSRIYHFRKDVIQKLTKDDTIKRKKVIQTSIGKRTVDTTVLTKAMGMGNDRIVFSINKIDFLEGDMFVLASDGLYTARSNFENDMILLNQSENLKSDFDNKIKKYLLFADDDLTGIVLKRI